MQPYRAETTSDPVRSLSCPKLEVTDEGNGSPDREPQSPSRSISQTVSVANAKKEETGTKASPPLFLAARFDFMRTACRKPER
jgi:hypothetical protein